MPETDVGVNETEAGLILQGCLPQMLVLLKKRQGSDCSAVMSATDVVFIEKDAGLRLQCMDARHGCLCY
jgi:hypothetical protein